MIRLTEVRRTCDACPSQLEGTTEDGRAFYARYRHGRLRWGLGLTAEDAARDAMRPDNRGRIAQFGGVNDGYMDTDEMLRHIGAEVIA